MDFFKLLKDCYQEFSFRFSCLKFKMTEKCHKIPVTVQSWSGIRWTPSLAMGNQNLSMYWQVNQNQKSFVVYSISDHFLYFPFQPVSQFTDIYMKEWLLKYVEKKRVRASYLLVFKKVLLCWIKFIWCTCWIYLFYTLRFSAPLSLIGKLKRINW